MKILSMSLVLILLISSLSAQDEAWEDVPNPEFAYRGFYKLISGTIRVHDIKAGPEISVLERDERPEAFHCLYLKHLPDLTLHLHHDPDMALGELVIRHMTYPGLLDTYIGQRSSLISYCGTVNFREILIRGEIQKKAGHLYVKLNLEGDFKMHFLGCGDIKVRMDILLIERCLSKFMYDKDTRVEFEKED